MSSYLFQFTFMSSLAVSVLVPVIFFILIFLVQLLVLGINFLKSETSREPFQILLLRSHVSALV